MNSKYCILTVLMAVLTLMTSCLKDDTTEIITYDDAAIVSFTLGTLNRTMHVNKKGKDSVFTTTVSCSNYAFTIDQAKGLIYNLDSLPVGTRIEKSVVTIGTKNSGHLYIKSLTSDSLTFYSGATDSIDFSKPRMIRCYANDGTFCKDYTIDVRVHKESADSLYWDACKSSSAIADLQDMRGLSRQDELVVYGTVNGVAKAYTSKINDGDTWTELVLPTETPMSMITDGSYLYALADGVVYSDNPISAISEGGSKLGKANVNSNLKTLVAASRLNLYAIGNDGKMMVSTDKGVTWAEDDIDDDASKLPSQDISSLCYISRTNADIDKIVLIGNRGIATESTCVVWSKIVDNGSPADTQPWMYQRYADTSWHYGPCLEHLTAVAYNDGILMFGGKGIGLLNNEPFSTFYFSKDDGQNWWKDSHFYFPAGFSSSKTSFTMIADSKNYLWLLCGETGQVWRGHFSTLTWE